MNTQEPGNKICRLDLCCQEWWTMKWLFKQQKLETYYTFQIAKCEQQIWKLSVVFIRMSMSLTENDLCKITKFTQIKKRERKRTIYKRRNEI